MRLVAQLRRCSTLLLCTSSSSWWRTKRVWKKKLRVNMNKNFPRFSLSPFCHLKFLFRERATVAASLHILQLLSPSSPWIKMFSNFPSFTSLVHPPLPKPSSTLGWNFLYMSSLAVCWRRCSECLRCASPYQWRREKKTEREKKFPSMKMFF